MHTLQPYNHQNHRLEAERSHEQRQRAHRDSDSTKKKKNLTKRRLLQNNSKYAQRMTSAIKPEMTPRLHRLTKISVQKYD